MRFLSRSLFMLAALSITACPLLDEPTKEEAAEYFGLKDGRELSFEVTDGTARTTAKHQFHKSKAFADVLAMDREERNSANILVETLVFEAALEEMRLLREGDCVPRCKEYASPPLVLKKPIPSNASFETYTAVKIINNGNTTDGPGERHQITIGSEMDVPTPGGTFRAYLVSWRVFTDGQTGSVDREMYFAPDKGFIQLRQGSATYRLTSGVSP